MDALRLYLRAGDYLVLVYLHHAGDPEVSKEISNGVMVGKVIDEGQKEAALRMDIMSDTVAALLMLGQLDDAMRLIQSRTGYTVTMPGMQPAALPAPQGQVLQTLTCPACGHTNPLDQICCGPAGPGHTKRPSLRISPKFSRRMSLRRQTL